MNQLVISFCFPRHFLYIVSGPILDLHVYLADVFAHYAQTDEDGTTDKPDGEDDGRPAGNGIVKEHGMDDIKEDAKGCQNEQYAHGKNHAHGLDTERGDAVDGKIEHLAKRILALAGLALGTVIIDAGRLVTYQGDNASKEEIALTEIAELDHGATTHQPVIGMVVYRLDAEDSHQLVKSKGSGAFEPRVGGAAATHAIDDVASVIGILVYHLGDNANIVLQIGIDRYHQVGEILGHGESCHKGVLMTHVAGEFHTVDMLTGIDILLYHLPASVTGAIIDIEYRAVG